MDLESYTARYTGETRLQRLLLIARTTSDEALASQAFDVAEEQMRRDGNTKRYKEVFGRQQQQHPSESEDAAATGEFARMLLYLSVPFLPYTHNTYDCFAHCSSF